MAFVRNSGRAEIKREGPEHAMLLIKDGCGPAGAQAMLKSHAAVVDPQGISGNIFDNDWFASIGGCAAGAGSRADGFAIYRSDVAFRETGRCAMTHVHAIRLEQQD